MHDAMDRMRGPFIMEIDENGFSAMKIKENLGKLQRKLNVGTKCMILTSSDQNKSSEFSLTPDPFAGAFL